MEINRQVDFIYHKYQQTMKAPATSEGLAEAQAYLAVLGSLIKLMRPVDIQPLSDDEVKEIEAIYQGRDVDPEAKQRGLDFVLTLVQARKQGLV